MGGVVNNKYSFHCQSRLLFSVIILSLFSLQVLRAQTNESIKMEAESNSNPKAPLLVVNERKRIGRLSGRNSVRTLRDEFFNRLPDKVRSGVDVESPFHIDVSKTKGLTEGLSLSVFRNSVCLVALKMKEKETEFVRKRSFSIKFISLTQLLVV